MKNNDKVQKWEKFEIIQSVRVINNPDVPHYSKQKIDLFTLMV